MALRAPGTLALAVWVAGCDPPVPRQVYLPAPEYAEQLHIAVDIPSSGIRPGEWVTLHATRSTGPWVLVPREQADLTGCWWRRPPAPTEEAVEGSVRWEVDPREEVRFNLPMSPRAARLVRFDAPGSYRLWARSAGCHPDFGSDTVSLEVGR